MLWHNACVKRLFLLLYLFIRRGITLTQLHISMPFAFALLFTGLFFIHFLVSLFLGDSHDDVLSAGTDSLDALSGGFSIFSLFTLAGLLSGISIGLWTYLIFDDASAVAIGLAIAAGGATAAVYGGIRKWIRGLDNPGGIPPFAIEEGDEGIAYIRIHANNQKGGQAYFEKHHQRRTFDAITEEDQPILSSTHVVVVDVIGRELDSPIVKVITRT